jgi:oxygen-dependent protoporphyrinogen oxidase
VTGEQSHQPFTRQGTDVVLAIPAYAAAALVAPIDANAAQALRQIPYAPVAVVVSAYRRADIAHPLDGFGFLAPAKERPAVLGALFSSTMFDGRAPDGSVLLTTFVGGLRDPAKASAADAEVTTAVGNELTRLVGARRAPLWCEVTRWERAIPQYTLGHLQRIAAIEDLERKVPGLFFCANYRGGVSIGDCVKSGHAMADRIAGRALRATAAEPRFAATV